MTGQFEFVEAGAEALFVVRGSGTGAAMEALFGVVLPVGQLVYRRWAGGDLTEAAACWLPPERLELRVSRASAPRLRAVLAGLRSDPADSSFADRIRSLITRFEAWSYADSDSGSGPAESLANDLRGLLTAAPTPTASRVIQQAQDGLDDGLPAEVIIGTLDRALQEIEAASRRQPSGLDPSVSG